MGYAIHSNRLDRYREKEAKGLNDFSLGEVQAVGTNYIFTQKGTISRSKFYTHKCLVRGLDGHTLWSMCPSPRPRPNSRGAMPPAADEYNRYGTAGTPTDVDMYVPSVL